MSAKILRVEAVLLLIPAIVSLIYREAQSATAFFITAAIVAAISIPISLKKPQDTTMYAKEGLVIVALVWIIWSVFGALPFYISGEIPHFVDCLFETVSGFTTTGSTILTNVEVLSYGMLFWRSFTHWIGGMGVLIFVMAVIPLTSKHSIHLMRAEMPGPDVDKLVPKAKSMALILYGIYAVMTLILVVLLLLGDMPLFDSIIHAFGTAGTGGFSMKNASIGYYNSAYIDNVLAAAMLLFGVNFNVYFYIVMRRFGLIKKEEEVRVYFGIVLLSVLLITLSILPIYESAATALRYSFFQVTSVISTTGYATADYNTWPQIAKTVLLLLTAIGACAGSTAGGIKVSRIVILFRSVKLGIKKMIHPKAVGVVKMGGSALNAETVRGVLLYMIGYVMIFGAALLIVSFNQLDFETTFSSVLTCLGNVGPGFGAVGPASNFAALSNLSKVTLSFVMLFGRLEIFPLLMLFTPAIWKKKFV